MNCARASITARPPVFMCTHKYQLLKTETCGYETWSLTLREKRRTRVMENRVLRRIFELKRDEVTGKWRRLHNVELRDLYSSGDQIRNNETLGVRGMYGGQERCIQCFGGEK